MLWCEIFLGLQSPTWTCQLECVADAMGTSHYLKFNLLIIFCSNCFNPLWTSQVMRHISQCPIPYVINPYGCDKGVCKRVISESGHQRRLSRVRASNKKKLDNMHITARKNHCEPPRIHAHHKNDLKLLAKLTFDRPSRYAAQTVHSIIYIHI